jgi:hypothetical protein
MAGTKPTAAKMAGQYRRSRTAPRKYPPACGGIKKNRNAPPGEPGSPAGWGAGPEQGELLRHQQPEERERIRALAIDARCQRARTRRSLPARSTNCESAAPSTLAGQGSQFHPSAEALAHLAVGAHVLFPVRATEAGGVFRVARVEAWDGLRVKLANAKLRSVHRRQPVPCGHLFYAVNWNGGNGGGNWNGRINVATEPVEYETIQESDWRRVDETWNGCKKPRTRPLATPAS